MTEQDAKAKTVVVGMSGGVDSSVAALLLKQQGYNVIGLHMKGANPDTAEQDEAEVMQIARKLEIEVNVIDYAGEMQVVKDYFVSTYLEGKTPNPCVICNKEVKFKPFIEFAQKVGADYFATGHYARIIHDGEAVQLITAVDEQKDQSYFLCELSKSQLKKALFPLGELSKAEVRKVAEEAGLITANKKDSYDVCFLGSEKFKDFMSRNYPEKSGDIIDINSGKVVGKHTGISKYTLGQRKGLGIGGGHGETGDCWFVTNKNIKTNTLFVAQGADDALYSTALKSNNFNWIDFGFDKKFECYAKFRYRQTMQKVMLSKNDDGSVQIEFAEPQRAITIGQYAVVYIPLKSGGWQCLGGGQIDHVYKNGKEIIC